MDQVEDRTFHRSRRSERRMQGAHEQGASYAGNTTRVRRQSSEPAERRERDSNPR